MPEKDQYARGVITHWQPNRDWSEVLNGPELAVAHEVDRLCSSAAHEVPDPPELRIWSPHGRGDHCCALREERAPRIRVLPGIHHGQVVGPIVFARLNVMLLRPTGEVEVLDLAEDATLVHATPHPTLVHADLHILATDPESERMVTVWHRDALLSLARAVVYHGVQIIHGDRTSVPRARQLRQARQLAEFARFIPPEPPSRSSSRLDLRENGQAERIRARIRAVNTRPAPLCSGEPGPDAMHSRRPPPAWAEFDEPDDGQSPFSWLSDRGENQT